MSRSSPAGPVPPLKDQAKELYSDASPVTRFFATHRPTISPFDLLLPLVPAGASVLDVGCGNGLLLGLLARDGKLGRGVGFDSSRKAIDRANGMLRNLNGSADRSNIQFIHLDVDQPWPEGTFDVVTIVDVLHHVPKPHQQSVIQQAAGKLAPGGRLIYKDMARRPIWRATMNRLHDLVVSRQWINYAKIEDVERWARDAGLTRQTSNDVNILWYRHELRVFAKPDL